MSDKFKPGDVVRWKVQPYARPNGVVVTHGRGTIVEHRDDGVVRVRMHNMLDQPTAAIVRFNEARLENATHQAPTASVEAMRLADDFAAAAVNHYSAEESNKALWQKMVDARQVLETKLTGVK